MREPDQRLYMAYYINVNTVGHGLYKIKIKRLKNLWIHDFNVSALVYPTKKNNKLLKYLLQFKLNVLQNVIVDCWVFQNVDIILKTQNNNVIL